MQIFMHHIAKRDGEADAEGEKTVGETLTQHWEIRDKYAFENIGVTKPVQSKKEGQTDDVSPAACDFRYLTCCDCDAGPVGITFSSDPNTFYLTHGRVKYM